MAQPEPYVLDRNPQESKRLNSQHEFVRLLCHGHLIHPSIPQNEVQAIADVGTGTGVWLQQVAKRFPRQKRELVGFDISSLQFPTSENHPDGVRFVVHDMTHPFPKEYHGKFDLVHVRFLSYGLRQQDLKATVENLTEMLR